MKNSTDHLKSESAINCWRGWSYWQTISEFKERRLMLLAGSRLLDQSGVNADNM